MFGRKKRIAVVAVDVPWRNIECLGIFGSFRKANKKACECAKDLYSLTEHDKPFEYFPLNDFGTTSSVDEGGDGYEFIFLEAPFEGCYVMVEDRDSGETDFKGPFHDYQEANSAVFGPKARKKFVLTAGTLGAGFYPVEKAKAIYTYIPIYKTEGGN